MRLRRGPVSGPTARLTAAFPSSTMRDQRFRPRLPRQRKRPDMPEARERARKEQNSMAEPKLDRLKAIDGALSQIERQFGKGAIMRLGPREGQALESISTGSISVDAAIGIGGFPRGRVIEVYGPE